MDDITQILDTAGDGFREYLTKDVVAEAVALWLDYTLKFPRVNRTDREDLNIIACLLNCVYEKTLLKNTELIPQLEIVSETNSLEQRVVSLEDLVTVLTKRVDGLNDTIRLMTFRC